MPSAIKAAVTPMMRLFQMQKGSFNNSFLHNITCRTHVRSQAVKCHMNRLPFSRVLVVVRNKDSHDMTMKYEVYGYENGLQDVRD